MPKHAGPATNPDDTAPGYGYANPLALREDDIFFYHSDHLGSTAYVTDAQGTPTQFVCYMPFGAAFVDEHRSTPEQPYKFNGKEMDAETGLYYYGARYYDPDEARWYGVDPLAEKRYWLSPYNFVQNNPISRIDPTGALDTRFEDEEGNEIANVNDGSNAVFQIKGEGTDKHYEFKNFDESQGGRNEINVTSVVQEQQKYNMTNPDLEQESNGQTWCNRATLNVMKSVESAFGALNYMPDAKISLPIANANTLTDKLAESTTYKPIDQATALSKAENGHMVVLAWKNPIEGRSGHLATLSVGENRQNGQIANIGPKAYSGFVNLNTAFSKDKQSSIIYYIIDYKK